jgi:hypothetical protein
VIFQKCASVRRFEKDRFTCPYDLRVISSCQQTSLVAGAPCLASSGLATLIRFDAIHLSIIGSPKENHDASLGPNHAAWRCDRHWLCTDHHSVRDIFQQNSSNDDDNDTVVQ